RNIWTTEGDYADAKGRKLKARDLISRPRGEGQSPGPGAGQRNVESTVRLIRPDLAIEDGISRPLISEDGGAVTARFSAVWVKQDNQWRLEALREAVVTAPTLKDHLSALDWLLGEWIAETDNGAVLVSSHWADDDHYIVRDFAIHDGQSQIVTCTQRIG